MVLWVSLRIVLTRTSEERSQSGKKISTSLMPRSLRASTAPAPSSWPASKRTSPVDRSTTSARKQAFSTADSSTERSSEPFFAISFWSSTGELDAGENDLGLALDAGVPVAHLLLPEDVLADRQVRAPPLEARRHRHVELAEDRLVGLQAQRPQEDRRRELALPVDPHEEDGLLVVLELHPGAAVRDDLGQVPVGRLLREEDARGPVELRDDDALRAVDDERAVLGHQRDVAEEDLLFLGVPHRLDARLRVLVVDEEAEGHLERDRVGHPPLLALGHGVLHLQVDRVAADVAEGDLVRILRAALVARDDLLVRMRGHDPGAARAAVHAQVLEALEPAALALPVADRVLDELQLAGAAEVREREDAREHRLEPRLVPLLGEQVHLQETLVRPALDVDQVRKIHERADLREVLSLCRHSNLSHSQTPCTARDAARPRN